jgi:ABC-type Fe3+-hydroxamate transport system substrate-binding protein
MPVFVDQLGRKLSIASTPKRIISLVPSQTELLYDLGIEDEVIGITKFCIHPDHWFQSKTRIGGTKNLNLEKIKAMQPHLIIANKEENVKEQIDTLAEHFPVWISDINTLDEALQMINEIGIITGYGSRAVEIAEHIKERFESFSKSKVLNKYRTAYLIWKDPYMTVGGDTFINHILKMTGFENLFESQARYPVIDMDSLSALDCELLLLSSEPFPFSEKHIKALQQQLPKTKILLVDGEMFSWYGSRLLHTPAYLKGLQQQIAAIS